MTLNIIPRGWGNTFSGSVFGNTGARLDAGLQLHAVAQGPGLDAGQMNYLCDVDAMGGGRIIRDKLWFYLTVRQVGSESTVPGMWVNKNANNPNCGPWISTSHSQLLRIRKTGTKSCASRGRLRDATSWQATGRSSTTTSARRAAARTQTPEAQA